MISRSSQRSRRAGRSWRYPAAALGLTVLTGAAAAGCGSTAAPGSGSAGQGTQVSPAADGSHGPTGSQGASPAPAGASQAAALCTDTAAIRALSVVRNRDINRIGVEHFPFPGQVTVTSAVSAQAVAKAVCALPSMPRGAISCPMELPGTSYRLTFTVAGRTLPVVTVQATGCQQVTGAGPARRAISPGFWRVLGNAIGLYKAGPPVFGGDGPTLERCHVRVPGQQLASGCPAMPSTRSPVPAN